MRIPISTQTLARYFSLSLLFLCSLFVFLPILFVIFHSTRFSVVCHTSHEHRFFSLCTIVASNSVDLQSELLYQHQRTCRRRRKNGIRQVIYLHIKFGEILIRRKWRFCCCGSGSFSSSESSFRWVFLSQSYSPCRIWWRSLWRYFFFLSYPLFLFSPAPSTSKHLRIYTHTQCKHVFPFNLSFYTFALLVNQILKCSVQTEVDIRRHLYNKARTTLLIVEYL